MGNRWRAFMKSLAFAAALSVFILGSTALAQTALKPVTRAEVSAQLDSAFAAADKNHDGNLSVGEMQELQNSELQTVQTALRNRVQAQFKALDTNKDGQLSLAEFSAATPSVKVNETPQQLIQNLDTNKDGKVSADEFKAPRIANFNKADLNHDGTVTPAEMQAATGKK
jgi:Ca2+-binding EF-hand superfamily protein